MAHTVSGPHLQHRDTTSPWRVLHGFNLGHGQHGVAVPACGQPHAPLTPQRASCVSKSLLSQRLLNREAAAAHQHPHEDSNGSGSEAEEDATDDGCFFEDAETESWSWLPAEEASIQDSDRSSLATASSQPIAIPASCYFKDEVQRAALDKLNQKRKWYQQQLEAERMVARSMAKSRQAVMASRSNRPAGRPGAPA